jgi:quercetin dioxygenase-like cupin family protein
MRIIRPDRLSGGEHFTGAVWLETLKSEPLKVLRVSFEAGSRTFWHRHPSGQTLYVLSGTARIGIEDENGKVKVSEAGPQELIEAVPNQRHWHGAGPDSTMAHIAIQSDIEWEERAVTDAEYNS